MCGVFLYIIEETICNLMYIVRCETFQISWLSFYFYSQTYNALFCETSAKDGSNIVEAVLHLAR